MSPPSSRRSSSTSAIESQTPPTVPKSRHQDAAALPPPPPGPPPVGRSISHDRAPSNVPILSIPTRRPPQRGTALEPVPPTPADWSEFPNRQDRSRSPLPALHTGAVTQSDHRVPILRIETSVQNHRPVSPIPDDRSRSTNDSSSGPSRSSFREHSAKGIRERRSESRAAKDRAVQSPDSEVPQSTIDVTFARPADLNLSSPGSGGGISRQRAVKRTRASISPIDPRVQHFPAGKASHRTGLLWHPAIFSWR